MFSHSNKPARGIIFTISGVVLGLIVGVLIKRTASEASLITVLFYRFVFSIPLLLCFCVFLKGKNFLKIEEKKTMLFRLACGLAGMVFWMLSIRNLPLGQATALFQSSVLFVTILSPFLLGELVCRYRWISVITGIFGVLILTNPFSQSASFALVYGICAAVCGALLSIVLRRLGKSDSALSVALIYNSIASIFITIIVLLVPSQFDSINGNVFYELVLLGVITSFSQLFFTGAYHYVDAVVISSLRYLQVPLAALTGFVIFSETLGINEVLGAAIVVFSCSIISWREVLVKNKAD